MFQAPSSSETTESGQPIIWTPTPRQSEFLAADDYEVLYGGAAGGGKSDALLIDAWCLQHNGPLNANHRGIIFRRTYKDLADLIDRGNAIFPGFIEGVTYNANDHVFETPAGAKLYLSHLQHDKHRFNHRGRAYNYIGFDELTLWATDVCWVYLQSRNRTVDRNLPCYMRATTNPDGPGQKWVMERFGIEETGGASRIETEIDSEVWIEDIQRYELLPMTYVRRFIPAKLVDNPYLRGTGYRERLMLMPPDEAEALLKGLWRGNRVEGAYYFKELQRARAEGRIGRFPHRPEIPVNTFWDLGKNDFNSIWFHQSVAMQNLFVHAYQNSGEYLPHYAAYLMEVAKERGFVYDTHYLPHDGAHKPLTSGGKSAMDQLQELMPGQRFQIVPKVDRRIDGINQARAAFASCFIDDTPDGCADGLASLASYRKRFNNAIGAFTDEHVHDAHSNYADAFRQFAQGYDGAQTHINAAEPEWRSKLRQRFPVHANRNSRTA